VTRRNKVWVTDIATPEVRYGAGWETRWLQWRDRGLFDIASVLRENQSVGRDITARKQAEDERRQLEAQRSVDHHLVKPVDVDSLRGLLEDRVRAIARSDG
jgi:PAS domain-containing protein